MTQDPSALPTALTADELLEKVPRYIPMSGAMVQATDLSGRPSGDWVRASDFEETIRALKSPHHVQDGVVEALRELVRLKDLSDRLRNGAVYKPAFVEPDLTERARLRDEYERCKPLAWEAARKALTAAPAQPAQERDKDGERYRAWRDGVVVVRRSDPEGWEVRHRDDPHWDVGSWFWSMDLDAAIDAAIAAEEKR